MANTKTMIPSKWIKQEDIKEPMLVTIASVRQDSVGRDEEATIKWIIQFQELDKPMTLNVVNILTLESYLGEETDNWIGKKTVIFVDPNVMFEGKRKGGIRLRAPKGAEPKKDDLPF